MLRGFLLIFLLFGVALVAVFGFRGQKSTAPPLEIFPDMVRQMKVRAQAPLAFFADGRGPRLPVAGTMPIGYEMPKPANSPGNAPPEDLVSPQHLAFSVGTDYYDTGKMGDRWGTGIPVEVTRQLMERGQQRFNITCAMCHGATAAGNGITKQYGLATVVTLQDERIRKMSDGEIFNTITNGKNTMMAYGPNIIVPDRWAIIAYLGALLNPHQFSYSWLFAFAFFFTLCAGCFFWTIVHHATDANWSVVVRRQLENIAVLLVVLAVLFVPILLLRRHLYSWMDIPPGVEHSLDAKRDYLNWYFFLIRAVVFLGFFLCASLALRRLSVKQDKDGNPRFTILMRKLAFISLPMFALCLTFGAFDWLMSLNYRWFSTMFGVYIFAGAA